MTYPVSNSPRSQLIQAQQEPSNKTGRFAKLNSVVSRFSLIALFSETIKFAKGKIERKHQKNERTPFQYSNRALDEIRLDDTNAKLKALNPSKQTIHKLEINLRTLSKADENNPLLTFDQTEKIILESEIENLRCEIKALKAPFERVHKLEERKTQLENRSKQGNLILHRNIKV